MPDYSYWLSTTEGRVRLGDIDAFGDPKYDGTQGWIIPAHLKSGPWMEVAHFTSERAAADFLRNRFPTIELG
jgi:hypothetical protein